MMIAPQWAHHHPLWMCSLSAMSEYLSHTGQKIIQPLNEMDLQPHPHFPLLNSNATAWWHSIHLQFTHLAPTVCKALIRKSVKIEKSRRKHTHTHRDFRENWYVNVCNGTMYDHRIHIVWMEGTQPLRFSFPWWRFPLRSIGIVYMRWIVSSESRCYIIVSMFMHIYLWYV